MAKFEPFKIGENTESVAKFVKTTCLHPIKVRHYDPHLRRYVEVHHPCGHCDNCQYKLQQRWVERMETHCLNNPYCYFVTLTYDSKFLIGNEEYLRETNAYTGADGRPVPLTLCKTHLRDFLNRLRKQTQKYGEFTYFACGEYGDEHCRPHYHLLLWSKSELSHYNIRKAWSLGNNRIGISYIADLHSNGTFGVSKDVAKSIGIKEIKPTFKYVCKYMRKYKRHMKAPYEAKLRENFESLGPNEVDVISLDYCINKVNFDKTQKYNYDWRSFKKAYSPFIVCSTRRAIGSEYFQEHYKDFVGSTTRRITLPTGSDVQVSGYFAKVIKKRFSPYYSKSFESDGYTSPFDYQAICEKFSNVCRNMDLFGTCEVIYNKKLGRAVLYYPYAVLNKFYDPVCSCWYELKKRYNGFVYQIKKFDRHLRKFVLCGFQSLKDFALEYIKKSQAYLRKYLSSATYVEKLDEMYDNWIEMSAKLSGVTTFQAQLVVDSTRSSYVGAINVAQQKYYEAKRLERKVRPIYNRLVV